MQRRDFAKTALGALAGGALLKSPPSAEGIPCSDFPKASGITDYVAAFVETTKYDDIPADVIELGKKSILDGLGLALAGSKAETGALCRQYVEKLGISGGQATIAGSTLKTSPRFAAFVNGVSIHADDFDDTQLAVAKDRVYGLLTHPTAPVLPPAFAIAEAHNISGKALMAAYFAGVEVET